MTVAKLGPLCVACILAGCSGAQVSLEHFSDVYGQAPPVPQSGGGGPKLFQTTFDPPTGDFAIPTRLPELLAAHRQQLLARAHPLPASHAENYADTEIAGLRKRYAGQDDALRAELTRRLRPVQARPGSLDAVNQLGPLYPPDQAPGSAQQRRPQ